MILLSLFDLALRRLPPLPTSLGSGLGRLRREVLPTDEERDAAYLAAAGDLYELEFRMRELNRPNRQRRGSFRPF